MYFTRPVLKHFMTCQFYYNTVAQHVIEHMYTLLLLLEWITLIYTVISRYYPHTETIYIDNEIVLPSKPSRRAAISVGATGAASSS
jgi:hypothetical protein